MTSALLAKLARNQREYVKESVRIETKRRRQVRTREDQRNIAMVLRRKQKFVKIYTGIGIEEERYQTAARARTAYEFLT